MKFGGPSTATPEAIVRVARLVSAEQARQPMAVVSADARTTDLLESAAWAACMGREAKAAHWPVAHHHYQLLEELALPSDFLSDILDGVLDLLKGIRLLGELTPRTLDRLLAHGELLLAPVVAEVLCREGLRARAWPAWELGMLTDSSFGAARMLPEAPELMRRAWRDLEGVIPVVTGFTGQDGQGNITRLGKGGADVSASLFGAALGATEIQIWTDASGVMTADARSVPTARSIPRLSYQEAAELAFFGTRALHPGAIEPAVEAGIPVRVKNTFAPEEGGTLIVKQVDDAPGLPTGIAFRSGISEINVSSVGMLDASGFLARVFEAFARHRVCIDVVSTSEVNLSFTVDAPREAYQGAVDELSTVGVVSVREGRSAICIVGEGLKSRRGFAARIFGVLGRARVGVEMISQGASQVNITFLVRDEDCHKAVRALHAEFFEDEAVQAV